MKAKLSEEEKIYIIKNYEIKTLGRLSEIISKSRSTIYFFYKRWLATKTIINKKSSGRKHKLSSQLNIRIENFLNKNPLFTVRQLREKFRLQCSLSCLQNFIKKLGFKSRRYKRKPLISSINKIKRVEFARKYLHWSIRDWKKVLFSDECSIELGKIYPRKIWIKKENFMKPGFFLPRKQAFGKKYIKIWSCFAFKGVGKLQYIENGEWNRHAYKKILENNLKREAQRLIGRDFIFQEDGDRVHTSAVVKTWKRRNKISILDWPPESCDLSPIGKF